MSNEIEAKILFNARNVLLVQLETQGYDVSQYKNISTNELHALYSNQQLDMVVEKKDGSKALIHHSFAKLRKENLDAIAESAFVIDAILSDKKKDMIVIVANYEPNDKLIARMKYMYDRDETMVVIRTLERLQFNLLDNNLVPNVAILTDEELDALKRDYSIRTLDQLPEISRFDPMALAIFMRPNQVCRLNRKSVTAVNYTYYRACVQ
jgi:DNA-directed RNA polymerase subunit H (RpoH/RPB5)